jgi:hypothetical protein
MARAIATPGGIREAHAVKYLMILRITETNIAEFNRANLRRSWQRRHIAVYLRSDRQQLVDTRQRAPSLHERWRVLLIGDQCPDVDLVVKRHPRSQPEHGHLNQQNSGCRGTRQERVRHPPARRALRPRAIELRERCDAKRLQPERLHHWLHTQILLQFGR